MSPTRSAQTPQPAPRVAFMPQDADWMRERYAAALEPVYDQVAVAGGFLAAPSSKERHVFDFRDGLRLIVSRERTEQGALVLHLSASCVPGLLLHTQVTSGFLTKDDFLAHCVERWQRLSGRRVRPTFLGVHAESVPHWCVEESN